MKPSFSSIAVIGAGTMGGGIAGQIANAGHDVLLLDLPADDANANAASKRAVERLLKSDPPLLMDKSCAERIECGNTRDDFDRLAECDWIIEAVVERLDIKQELYKQLAGVINPDCIVTSNTSTIPIEVLMQGMPLDFAKRFAITHYFNPVRYMRLLELVRGNDTAAEVMAKLADYNDEFLGKGVVSCRDTPGFLGNRVGVFALQVGMDEAWRQGLCIEDVDALMGRPMGIPKTGVFGLYDLIGIDLMADVVNTLETILPDGDMFFAVGNKGHLAPLIASMIKQGFIGDKGGGGFYRLDDNSPDNNKEMALDIMSGAMRARVTSLPQLAIDAAAKSALGEEPLHEIIKDGDTPQHRFCRNVIARVLCYGASLIPSVTCSAQDIDDAMKLGFNWQRGPFEMIDAIGIDKLSALASGAGVELPDVLQVNEPFYSVKDGQLEVRHIKTAGERGSFQPVSLAPKTVRFHMLKRSLEPVYSNADASLYNIDEDLRLVEFHSKANALGERSMEVVARAAEDHGRGIIIHNDAQHFCAGVDLNVVLGFIHAKDWKGLDGFLIQFQDAVKALRNAPVPVIAAPSGLVLGGGFEIVLHTDKTVAHSNIVMGLVECAVGLVPGGGGVKETFGRLYNATGDWRDAAWQTWMQIGYARTGTSPQSAARLGYFLPGHDTYVMNRDKLVSHAIQAIEAMRQNNYTPPAPSVFTLPDGGLLEEMAAFMDKGVKDGLFFPHDKTTAMAVGGIVASDAGIDNASEDEIFARERRAFLELAGTQETEARIASMLKNGVAVRN